MINAKNIKVDAGCISAVCDGDFRIIKSANSGLPEVNLDLYKFIEFKIKRKDGKYIWVETEGSLLYKEGKPYAILGIANDITKRKKLEMAIQ